jgi:hypothetical protein
MLANVGSDLWDWVTDVFGRIGELSNYWLALALALKTAESALIAVGWRNILTTAYPRSGLSYSHVLGAHRREERPSTQLHRRRPERRR